MSARLDKIGADWRRAIKKAEEWSEKAKELERKYKEVENTEIHDLVHEAQLTPDQLAEVLKALKSGAFPSPAVLPDGAVSADAGVTENDNNMKEENEDED